MYKLLCLVLLGVALGEAEEQTTTAALAKSEDSEIVLPSIYEAVRDAFPETAPAFDAFEALLFDTEAGSNLLSLIEQYFGNNTDTESRYFQTFESAINSTLPAVLKNPEAFRRLLAENGGAVLQLSKVIMQNMTEETSDMRQQIMKDMMLGLMGALSTETGQEFMKTMTNTVLTSMMSNAGSASQSQGVRSSAFSSSNTLRDAARNAISMAMSFADVDGAGGSANAGAAASSLIRNNPLLRLLKDFQGSSIAESSASSQVNQDTRS